MTEDICRLCLINNDLVWIFDSRIAEPGNMKEVIHITTGVEIKNTDKVTQKVCKKCCQITIKMFKFRASALKNDKELKNRLLELELKTGKNTSPQGGQAEHTPNTVVEESTTSMSRNAAINSGTQKLVNTFVESAKKTSDIPSSNKPHDTVTELLHKYPQLKIPRSCLKCNLFPAVAINVNEVATWLTKKRKRDQAKEAQAREIKSKLSPPKSPVKITQGPNIGIDQNVLESLTKKMPKLVKRPVPSSVMPAAKRKMSSDAPMPKRKLSMDTMSSCSSDPDRDDMFSHPDSTARQKCFDGGEPELLSHINKSTNVNVCTICNAVTYSNKEMKLHSRKHNVCPFCKVRFRTMESKNSHVDRECPIKSIMQNLPAIPLVRVDQVKGFTEKYPNAFDCVHVVSSDDDGDDNVEILITDDSDDPPAMNIKGKATSGQEGRDEGAATVHIPTSVDRPTKLVAENIFNNSKIAIGIGQNEESIEHIDITVDDDVMYISDDEIRSERPKDDKVDTDKPRTPENHSLPSNLHQSQLAMELLKNDTNKTVNEPATKLGNAVKVDPASKLLSKCGVKLPLYNMSNDPFLDTVNAADKEASLIRMLLKEADKCPGLLPPTNKSITIQGTTDKIYALTNIVQYLRKYKIPVDLSFNNKLTVVYEPVKPSHQSKVEIWDPKMALLQRSMIPQPVVNNMNITHHQSAVNKSVTDSNIVTRPPAPAANTTGIQLPTNDTPVTGIQLPTNSTRVTGIQHTANSTTATGIKLPVTGIPLSTVADTQLRTNSTSAASIPPPMSSAPVIAKNVSTIANIENHDQNSANHMTYPGQHMSTVPSYSQIARAMDDGISPNVTSTNSRAIVLNPLLNSTLDRPVVNSGVYNSSNLRTVVTSGGFMSVGFTNPSSVRTASGTNSYSSSAVTSRELEVQRNNNCPPPPSYTPSVLRPPPPHYRPQLIQRIEDKSPSVHGAGLRVKTADELNKKF